ncbi:MAG: hypothetical protein EOM34_09530 [Clostridia bacterium]|nr:YabP/YqfC family sporulation protein [Lachnospiraceae bacterium]NCC00905.1 hypothetical protein [Clostridia bacterium]NCD03722.1 hypothetical protein [Clostridia bacterium]
MLKDWIQETQVLPEEIIQDIPVLYVLGQKEIKIMNYKKILHYSPEEMVLLLNANRLIVSGEALNIDYFNEDEICIRGHVISITYQSG